MSVAGALGMQGVLLILAGIGTMLSTAMAVTETETLAARPRRIAAAVLAALGILSLIAGCWAWVIAS